MPKTATQAVHPDRSVHQCNRRAGMIEFGLSAPPTCNWQALDVNSDARADLKGQKPCVLWFTGLSGFRKNRRSPISWRSGCFGEGRHTYLLDGDNVRHGLNQDLGSRDADRRGISAASPRLQSSLSTPA